MNNGLISLPLIRILSYTMHARVGLQSMEDTEELEGEEMISKVVSFEQPREVGWRNWTREIVEGEKGELVLGRKGRWLVGFRGGRVRSRWERLGGGGRS